MKGIVLAAALVTSCSVETGRDALAGRWEGVVEHRGATLLTVVDFSGGDSLRATIHSPDELRSARPVGGIRYDPPRLRFTVHNGPEELVFEGTRRNGEIVGEVRGGALRARLHLRRSGEVPPLPFGTEEVRIPSDGAVLAATLLVPRTAGPHPAVVLVHGSGPGPRSSVLPLAEAFARRGIAALVYDKRGDGASSGDWREVPFSRLATDARAAVAWLRIRPGIRTDRIGLWGGSEGGIVAPLAAAESGDVAFLILVSTIGVPAGEQDLVRIERQMRARGFTAEEIREATALRRLAHDYVRGGKGRAEYTAAWERARGRRWFRVPGLSTGPADRDFWWRWYRTKIDHDPAAVLERVRVPVLAVFGDADLVVDPELNAARIQAALRRGGNPDVTIRTFAGADHNLRLPGGMAAGGEARWDWPRVAPGYVDTVVHWTLRQTDAPPGPVGSARGRVPGEAGARR